MKFRSTRRASAPLRFSEAMLKGLAPDGGLYVPESFPRFGVGEFEGLDDWEEIGARLLGPFFEGDPLAPHVGEICREAFNFPIELKELDEGTAVLELFHGPTAAFKDVGARFLAACVSRLPGRRTVLVATSGDTGGAVAAAFHERPEVRVVILFPKGKVSPRQQQQLTCWGGSVRAFAVRGDFDDCQRVVKTAFMQKGWAERQGLLSANSINLGRLLPQAVYYAAASLWYLRRRGERPGFVIPVGNLGNAAAAFWARRMGLPVREFALATNANRAVPSYFETGEWAPRPTRPTLANAMDVGDPSNMERLLDLHPDFEELKRVARAFSVGDDEIARTIKAAASDPVCPHTATAVHARARVETPHWVVVATAHPAKFESVVEPLVGREVEPPPSLAELFGRPSRFEELDPAFEALAAALK
ncbi:MAG TPA: threonine synthase [Pyrinomonadaceae bacterium]|jgi:threonine synthase|nr:threonine synthase [Pyrinomonadaceae bacterium]